MVGPGISPFATSASFDLIKQFGDGTMKSGMVDLSIGAVDVRDVAAAHIAAGFSAAANGRYIVSSYNTSFPEFAQILKEQFGDAYPFPKSTLPKWMVWMIGPFLSKGTTRQFIARNIGFPFPQGIVIASMAQRCPIKRTRHTYTFRRIFSRSRHRLISSFMILRDGYFYRFLLLFFARTVLSIWILMLLTDKGATNP